MTKPVRECICNGLATRGPTKKPKHQSMSTKANEMYLYDGFLQSQHKVTSLCWRQDWYLGKEDGWLISNKLQKPKEVNSASFGQSNEGWKGYKDGEESLLRALTIPSTLQFGNGELNKGICLHAAELQKDSLQ